MIRGAINQHHSIPTFRRNISIYSIAQKANYTGGLNCNLRVCPGITPCLSTGYSNSVTSTSFGRVSFCHFSRIDSFFQPKNIIFPPIFHKNNEWDNFLLRSNNNLKLNQIRCRSNRSRRGLYDGKDVRFGNKVSFSGKKSRRKFKPNVVKKRLYSEILDDMIRFNVTTSALRSIDKAGGLDNYLLRSKHVTDEGQGGAAKKRIMEKMKELEMEEMKK